MRTHKLSLPILAIIMITFLSLGILGCDDKPAGGAAAGGSAAQSQPDSASDQDSGLTPEQINELEGVVLQDSGLSQEQISFLQGDTDTLVYQDPEGDVYDYDTGDDVGNHPELDLTAFEFSLDEDTQLIELRFTFAEEPGEDAFVSGLVTLVDETPPERPLGDPFASAPKYLYFWTMNDDCYAAFMQRVDGEVAVVDDSVKIGRNAAAVEIYVNNYQLDALMNIADPDDDFILDGMRQAVGRRGGAQRGSDPFREDIGVVMATITDGLGNCDTLD